MKKNNIIALALTAFVLTAGTVNAQSAKTTYSLKAAEPVSVRYISSDADYLIFELSINSAEDVFAALKITDKSGVELFHENVKSYSGTRTIKIEKGDFKELKFKLDLGGNVYTKVFSITVAHIEDTRVKEGSITMVKSN